MYPNNQPPQPQATPPNPYDFIYNSPSKPKSSLPLPGGKMGRIIVVAVGLIILFILFFVIKSFLGSSDKAITQQYIEIAQRQTEIIRLASIAEQKGTSLETRSNAIITKASITSSQSSVTAVIQKKGVSPKELSKQLTASKNAKSDATLAEAEKNNRFDETYSELIAAEITNYKKQLNAAASGASKSEKTVLEASFYQANSILPPTKK